jgi:peptidoglycan/LPS O-acetylase OafA/YrhL
MRTAAVTGVAPEKPSNASPRYASLDSLRGVAAIVVVVSHFAQVYFRGPAPIWIRYSPLRILLDGKASVLVFFALSGFVLFLTFKGRDRFRYWPYIVKRFFRLYPPFAVAILGAAIVYWIVRPIPIPQLGTWFNGNWSTAPTLGVIAGHLAMTDNGPWRSLDVVMWSLAHEARISLIFPIIALWVTKSWRAACITLFVVAFASNYVVVYHPVGWIYDPFQTTQYLFLFAGGASVALYAGAIRDYLAKVHVSFRIALWVAVGGVTVAQTPVIGNLADCAAILLVGLCFADPVAVRILSHGPFVWLGRISYSLYLVHLPILIGLLHVCYGKIPLAATLAIALVLIVVVSDLSYRLVERPSLLLGRRLASLVGGASAPRWPREGVSAAN